MEVNARETSFIPEGLCVSEHEDVCFAGDQAGQHGGVSHALVEIQRKFILRIAIPSSFGVNATSGIDGGKARHHRSVEGTRPLMVDT
ncbi:MAG: hypothetical protein B7Z40_13250 [Bosea sp. 12-68-7]|jgi:hypothetical protein|nr:MAG: hypothetical protein B7Z40_13250 [Bosea sp. 12-68-7]